MLQIKKFLPAFLIKHPVLYGAGALLLLGGGFLYVRASEPEQVEGYTAVRGEFLQTVSVSGKVVASDDVSLGFSGSGRIANINVKTGATVRAGAVLASLENSDAYAEVLQRQAALEVQEAKLDALREGTRPEQISVTESTIASNEVALTQSYQSVVDAIRNAYTKSDDAIHNQMDQFFDSPRSSNPALTFIVSDGELENQLENNRTAIEATLATWQNANLSLSASASVLTAAEETYARLAEVQDILALAARALVRAVPSGTITQATLTGYAGDIATARTTIDTALSSLTSSVTSARAAETALAVSKKNLVLQQAGSTGSDIAAQSAQVKVAQADLANAEAQLAKTYIRAPFAGVVTGVEVVRGDIVSPNATVISLIAPETLQVESYIPESQIGLIETGDRAQISLDALPGEKITATVASIDPAATVKDGVSTYRTVLFLEDGKERARSGMTGDVVITTDEREGVLSVPVGLVYERGGMKYVLVQNGEASSERSVETGGISSLGTIEIRSGVSEGDILLPPQM